MFYQTQPDKDSCLATCMASLCNTDIRAVKLPDLVSDEPGIYLPILHMWSVQVLKHRFVYYEFKEGFHVWAVAKTECVVAGSTADGIRHAICAEFYYIEGKLALKFMMNPSNIELKSIDSIYVLQPM